MNCPPKIPIEFVCNECNFKCCNKKDYNRHLHTAKHNNRINRMENTYKPPDSFNCDCGKQYKYKRGLWNHKQKCKGVAPEQPQETVTVSPEPVDSSLVIELLKQNQEFKEMMIEQHNTIIRKR